MRISGHSFYVVAFTILSCFCYYYIFFHLERSNFYELLLTFTILFWSYFITVKKCSHLFKILILSGIIFRILGVFSLPNLSQDYIRFFWDGQVMLNHISPYKYTPIELLDSLAISIFEKEFLIEAMGSLSQIHFSNYPPLNQFLFLISSFLFPKSILGFVVILKLLFIGFECITIFLGMKLLKFLKINESRILWYVLNPLVIIECFGNLHFEIVMITGIAIFLLFLFTKKYNNASFFLGLSILLKVIPLLFAPLVWLKIPQKNRYKFPLILSLTIIIGFIPFLDTELIFNYSKTMSLWINKFEFNGSIYYIFRTLGAWFYGYNPITFYGKIMISFMLIFGLSFAYFNRTNLKPTAIIHQMIVLLSVYLFLSTTVHPWYLCTLIFLNVFTSYSYIIVWSYLAILSYSAYVNPEVKEQPLFLILEYVPVILLFTKEIIGFNFRRLHHFEKR